MSATTMSLAGLIKGIPKRRETSVNVAARWFVDYFTLFYLFPRLFVILYRRSIITRFEGF